MAGVVPGGVTVGVFRDVLICYFRLSLRELKFGLGWLGIAEGRHGVGPAGHCCRTQVDPPRLGGYGAFCVHGFCFGALSLHMTLWLGALSLFPARPPLSFCFTRGVMVWGLCCVQSEYIPVFAPVMRGGVSLRDQGWSAGSGALAGRWLVVGG